MAQPANRQYALHAIVRIHVTFKDGATGHGAGVIFAPANPPTGSDHSAALAGVSGLWSVA